jgi:enoyl-CoA hydratase/carnithine racemase
MIDYEYREPTAWITIDRPEQKNALAPSTHRDLRAALKRAKDEASVAVVTGTGDAFCAGSDVDSLNEIQSADEVEALVEPEFRLHRCIESLSIPVVAAVNGLAYGGGFELVAVCDLAVAAADAEFALPEVRLGLTPGYALDCGLALVGRKRLLELALTGEPIVASTAREWGLVNRVAEPDELATEAERLAESVGAGPAYAARAIKRSISDATTDDVSYQQSVERLAALLSSEETRANLDEFFGDGDE